MYSEHDVSLIVSISNHFILCEQVELQSKFYPQVDDSIELGYLTGRSPIYLKPTTYLISIKVFFLLKENYPLQICKMDQPYDSHSGSSFMGFKLVLEKAEEPEIKLPTSTRSSKKQESSRKTSISALLTMPKPLTVWITRNCGKF